MYTKNPHLGKVYDKPAAKEVILRTLECGCYVVTAAKAAGFVPQTVYRWMREDPEFKQKIEMTREHKKTEVMQALDRCIAQNYFPAISFYLTHQTDEFKELGDAQQKELISKLLSILAISSDTLLPIKKEPQAEISNLEVSPNGIENTEPEIK